MATSDDETNPFLNFKNPKGTIELKLGFFPLGFFLLFCTPTVVINGNPQPHAWGHYSYEFAPGKYNVTIFFRYFFRNECGRNNVEFQLSDGETKTVSYYMWPWMFLPGTMSVR
ncbi:hypothetical protein [Mariniblastus fucicola]|uniref:Uncharacterized protein n=1 Tax=Mariniblastus fucicola TaxID=980251 RepID=A0A5B9P998_9BACT|nr:hypothetical protein [Mariniblastus fucicola]QEG22009.1 hypothetical protein MFFC18_18700 [Mariniblastus fucicola]